MGIVTPTNDEVLKLKGLHLYHSAISNCSMRVRIALEEKGLPWVSHHLDITKREHITPEYFGINLNGVVPTLVHDGVVVIESYDIIDYIDQNFSSPPLHPNDSVNLAHMYEWLELAGSIHVKAVKTYIYFKKMQGKMRLSETEAVKYEQLQKNKELLKFHEKSYSGEGITPEEFERAENILADCFDKVETALSGNKWLAGGQFSLADIAWIPLHFTLIGAGFSFDQYPAIQGWAQRISERDSFKKGVLKWCPEF